MASCFAIHAHGGYISPKKSTTRSPALTPAGSLHTTPNPLRCTANISGADRASAANRHSALALAVARAPPRRAIFSAQSSAASANDCVAAQSGVMGP